MQARRSSRRVRVIGAATLALATTAAAWPLASSSPSGALTPASGVPAAADPISGAWHAREYRLATGPVHRVRGQIFFVDGRWQVVFFVLDAAGNPQRGSAEGGSYRLQEDRLTFMHEVNFSQGNALPGLPAADLRMTFRSANDAAAEAARVAVDGDLLTLFFPSGNEMTFERAGDGS